MTQTHDEILLDLKSQIYHPVYLLEGEEPYYIDMVSDFIENNLLPERQRSFNQTILYGKDTNANDIRTRAVNYPMFSNNQVLIIKEAQTLKKWEDLVPYFEKPVRWTILVICHKYENFDKRTKAAKAIKENGVVMTTKKLFDNQVPAWIADFVNSRGMKIEAHAAAMMSECIGNDLSRIAGEFEKMLLNLAGRKQITLEDIERNIGISKEYNVFELTKALGVKDILKANRIVNYFADNIRANPLVVTLGSLYSFFSKIYLVNQNHGKQDKELATIVGVNSYFFNEYKIAARNFPAEKNNKVIELLHEYDLRSKGINNAGTGEGELLKELVYKILH